MPQEGFGYCEEIFPAYPVNFTNYSTTPPTAITDICGYRYEGTYSCEHPFVEDQAGWCCYKHFYMVRSLPLSASRDAPRSREITRDHTRLRFRPARARGGAVSKTP